MDSSTCFRSHPIEGFLYYGIGNNVCAAVFGTDVLSMALYCFILTFFLFFEHSNLRYPGWLNNALGWVLVMPDMHKVHHDRDQYYADSNFSNIFILSDRIFGTYRFKPVDQITYGLNEFESEEKQTFFHLMKSPFIHINRVRSKDLVQDKKDPETN